MGSEMCIRDSGTTVPREAWLVLDEILHDGQMMVYFCWVGYSGVVRRTMAVHLRLPDGK